MSNLVSIFSLFSNLRKKIQVVWDQGLEQSSGSTIYDVWVRWTGQTTIREAIPEDDWRRKELEDIGVCFDLDIRKAKAKLSSEAEANSAIDNDLNAFMKRLSNS